MKRQLNLRFLEAIQNIQTVDYRTLPVTRNRLCALRLQSFLIVNRNIDLTANNSPNDCGNVG